MTKVCFRVDANRIIGRGHLSRCIAMADMLNKKFEVHFLIQKSNKSFCEPLLNNRLAFYFENEKTLEALVDQQTILVIDNYEIDNNWRNNWRAKVKAIVEINDIPGEINGVDLIINHCPGLRPDMYTTTEETTFLLGLNYAILRPTFLDYSLNYKVKQPKEGNGIFLCFGGADPHEIGYYAAKDILENNFQAPVYLVIPKVEEKLLALGGKYSNLHILQNLDSEEMRGYMLTSRLLIISSSILSFEAIALRKPFLTIYYVENQRLIYEGLQAEDLAEGYGFIAQKDDIIGIAQKANLIYNSKQKFNEIMNKQASVLDGLSSIKILKQFILLDEETNQLFL